MPSIVLEDLRFTYLLGISAIAYLVFVLLKLGTTRAACYFSASLPGAFIAPFVIVWDLLEARNQSVLFGQLVGLMLFALASPGVWLFPIVLLVQIANLIKHRFTSMNLASAIKLSALALLYAWCDVVFDFIKFFK